MTVKGRVTEVCDLFGKGRFARIELQDPRYSSDQCTDSVYLEDCDGELEAGDSLTVTFEKVPEPAFTKAEGA